MRHDIDVTVAYFAPLLMRGQRGHAHLPAVVAQSIPARIRYVEPDAMAERRFDLLKSAGDRRTVREMDGRLWRLVTAEIGISAEVVRIPIGQVVEGLAGGGPAPVRPSLAQLSLQPWNVANQYGRLARQTRTFTEKDLPGGRVALDLRREARAAVASRLYSDIVHDGRHAWIATGSPLLHPEGGRTTWLGDDANPRHFDASIGCLPEEADRYVAFLGRLGSEGAIGKNAAHRFRSDCERFARDMEGIAVDPLAGVARFVRRQSAILHRAAGSYTGHAEDGLRSVEDAMAALSATEARATADLVPRDALQDAVEAMAALAAAMLARYGAAATGSHGAYRAEQVLAYVEEVARPILFKGPPAEDAADIGSFAP